MTHEIPLSEPDRPPEGRLAHPDPPGALDPGQNAAPGRGEALGGPLGEGRGPAALEVGGALVVGGTVTGYVGGGYSYRKTIASSATFAGSVGLISEGYGLDTRFQWGLCVYHWADQAEAPELASYPIVTYVVRPC